LGTDRLGEILQVYGPLPAESLRKQVMADVAGFTGEAAQSDDQTLVVVEIVAPDTQGE